MKKHQTIWICLTEAIKTYINVKTKGFSILCEVSSQSKWALMVKMFDKSLDWWMILQVISEQKGSEAPLVSTKTYILKSNTMSHYQKAAL